MTKKTMTTPREPELTDELLSAYIDNAVTPEERRIVEQAAAEDPDVAWRLRSLQMTVHLLHELPALALPRSFTLTPEQIGEPASGSLAAQPAPIAPPPAPRRAEQAAQPGFWARLGEGWRTFWQSGSPALRNAMATSLVLLFVFLAAPRFMTGPELESLGSVAVAPAAAPQAELARRSAPNPRATVMLRKVTAAETGARAANAARLATPAAGATLEQPATTGSEAPVTTADSVESADTPSPVAKMAAPESASAAESDGATEVVAADEAAAAAAAAPVAGSGEDVVVAATAMPAVAEAAPSMAVEAAPMALGAVGAGPTLDQSPAQDVDPLSAARAVAPAAESTGGGPSVQELMAPAMAAPAGAAAPLPAATSTSTQMPTATPTETPTATPTATPTVIPAATAPMAPTAASVAIEQGAEVALVPPPVAAQPGSSPAALPWLPIAQLVAAAGFLLFGLLWWRSRR